MYCRLIPSILIHEKRLVKGKRFSGYRDAGAPATTARAYNAQGADELIVCDIDASKSNVGPDFDTLRKVADECFMPLTIFGGINSLDRAEKCMSSGADKIGLTSAAIDDPGLIGVLAHRYGAQAVVLGVDVMQDDAGLYGIFDHRSQKILSKKPFQDWVREAVDRGVGEVRITAVDREGMMCGYDIAAYEMLRESIAVPIILDGGCGSLEHIEQACHAGATSLALGSMLVFSDANIVKIKQHMRTRNINFRS